VQDVCVASAQLLRNDTQLLTRVALDGGIAALPNSLGATK